MPSDSNEDKQSPNLKVGLTFSLQILRPKSDSQEFGLDKNQRVSNGLSPKLTQKKCKV